MTLGERIRRSRESSGYTQSELAKKIKTTKQTIHKYENGIVTNIPSDKIEALAKHLNTTPAHLMGWDEQEDREKTLRPDEQRLLDTYNILNTKGQDKLNETAEEMTYNPLYNDQSYLKVIAAHERTDITVSEDDIRCDDEMMMNDELWK